MSADYVNGGGFAPSANIFFVAPTLDVTITGPSQRIFVDSTKALGSTATGGGTNLNLWICYRAAGSTEAPTTVPDPAGSGGIFGLRVAQNTRQLFSLSAVIANLEPGTYQVALCGSSTNAASWNSNDFGYTSAIVTQH